MGMGRHCTAWALIMSRCGWYRRDHWKSVALVIDFKRAKEKRGSAVLTFQNYFPLYLMPRSHDLTLCWRQLTPTQNTLVSIYTAHVADLFDYNVSSCILAWRNTMSCILNCYFILTKTCHYVWLVADLNGFHCMVLGSQLNMHVITSSVSAKNTWEQNKN